MMDEGAARKKVGTAVFEFPRAGSGHNEAHTRRLNLLVCKIKKLGGLLDFVDDHPPRFGMRKLFQKRLGPEGIEVALFGVKKIDIQDIPPVIAVFQKVGLARSLAPKRKKLLVLGKESSRLNII